MNHCSVIQSKSWVSATKMRLGRNNPMMKYLFILSYVLFSTAAFGQIKGHTEPDVKLVCPEIAVLEGHSFRVTAVADPKLSEKQAAAVTHKWTVSWGTIAKGSGTDAITIEPAEGTGNITATVEIDNIWFQTITKSCTTEIQALPEPRLYDESEFMFQGYVKRVLDGFFADLSSNPASQGYIVIYPETERHYRQIERIIRNWVGTRRFDSSRVTFAKAKKNKKSIIQMWVVPPGAAHPELRLTNSIAAKQ